MESEKLDKKQRKSIYFKKKLNKEDKFDPRRDPFLFSMIKDKLGGIDKYIE